MNQADRNQGSQELWHRFKPGVPKRFLFLIAGAVWGFGGLLLCIRGVNALKPSDNAIVLISVAAGGGLLFFRLIFGRIVDRHMLRIRNIVVGRPCAFSFLDWRGYVVMTSMIVLGMALRVLSLVPFSLMGTISLIMGLPLLLSSSRFWVAGISSKRLP